MAALNNDTLEADLNELRNSSRAWPRRADAMKADLSRSGHLTADGVKSRLRETEAGSGTRMTFARELTRLRDQLGEKRNALREQVTPNLAAADPYTIALHVETRAFLRSLNGQERGTVLREMIRSDPRVADAVAAAPRQLSGIATDAEFYSIKTESLSPEVREQVAWVERFAKGLEAAERELLEAQAKVDELTGEPSALSGMTEADKVAYVRDHGADAFRKLLLNDSTAPQPSRRMAGTTWTLEQRNAYVDEHGYDALRAWEAGDPEAPWPEHIPQPEEDSAAGA